MKIYVMTRTTRFISTEECYTYADAFTSKRDAQRALTKELMDLVDEQDTDGVLTDFEKVYNCALAYRFGRENETHNAVIEFGDAEFYGDIFEGEV